MTYRAKASGRSARRKAHKECEFARAVAAEAAKKPPRVEIRRVPAMPPIESWFPVLGRDGKPLAPSALWQALEDRDHLRVIDLNTKPSQRVIEVPILPTPEHAVALAQGDRLADLMTSRYGVELFNVIEYGYRRDRTHVRWWGYAPVREELQRTEMRGLRRAVAFTDRAREVIKQIFGISEGNPNFGHYPGWSLRELVGWLEQVVEDLEQIEGRP